MTAKFVSPTLNRFTQKMPEVEVQENACQCWSCMDTGFVTRSADIREESIFPFPSTLPQIACRAFPVGNQQFCRRLYLALQSWTTTKVDGQEVRSTTSTNSSVEAIVRQRYDTSATREQCLHLHEQARQDAQTRAVGWTPTEEVRQKVRDAEKVRQALRKEKSKIGRGMPPAHQQANYSEAAVDAMANSPPVPELVSASATVGRSPSTPAQTELEF